MYYYYYYQGYLYSARSLNAANDVCCVLGQESVKSTARRSSMCARRTECWYAPTAPSWVLTDQTSDTVLPQLTRW